MYRYLGILAARAAILGLLLSFSCLAQTASDAVTNAPAAIIAKGALPGRPVACYLMQGDQAGTLHDSCGRHDGTIGGDQYSLSAQGITWIGAGSQVRTDIDRFPISVLACFTHEFGATHDALDVIHAFEKYPTLLSSDASSGESVSLEGQDGRTQGLNAANLGFLYFAEGDSVSHHYAAATMDGANGGPHCLVVSRDPSKGDSFYLDGIPLATAYNKAHASTALGNGHLAIGGPPGDPDYWFNGTLHLLVLWDSNALATQTDVNRALDWANEQLHSKGLPAAGTRPPNASDLRSRFVIVGDSITQCAGPPVSPEQCWALNIKLQNPAIQVVRLSIGGSNGQFAATTSPWREATLIDPRAPNNLAMFYYGINDGCRNQFTEEQVWQRATQWSRYMHSLGVRTLFGTMIDLGNSHSCGDNNESGSTFKRNLNSIARNHYSGIFDGIVDFASYPDLGADGASSGKCFGPDRVHPNAVCQPQMIQMTEDSANYVLGDDSKYITTPRYTMSGGDRRIILVSPSAAQGQVTLPHCYGKTGLPYTIVNGSAPDTSHTVHLLAQPGETMFGKANQNVSSPPGTSATVTAIVPDSSTAGCTWIRM